VRSEPGPEPVEESAHDGLAYAFQSLLARPMARLDRIPPLDVVRADNRLRILTVVALLAIATLGSIALTLFDSWLTSLGRLSAEVALHQLRAVFGWLAGIGGVALFALGAYLWRLGCHVRTVRQFPLPDSRVIRDIAVLREEVAVRRGMVIQALGVVLAICAVALLFFWWRLHFVLAPHAALIFAPDSRSATPGHSSTWMQSWRG
jgi:hypothetical protein